MVLLVEMIIMNMMLTLMLMLMLMMFADFQMNSIEWRGKPYEQRYDGKLTRPFTRKLYGKDHIPCCALLIHLHHLYLLASIT